MAKPTLELLDWERSLIGDRGFIYAAGCLADQYKNPHTAAARGFKAYVKEMPSREEAIMQSAQFEPKLVQYYPIGKLTKEGVKIFPG